MAGRSVERVVVVGSATVDEQVSADRPRRVQLGGVVTYGAAVFAREGIQTVAVCNLAESFAAGAGAVFRKLGIGLQAGRSDTMTVFRNRLHSDGEREQQLVDMSSPIDAELVRAALEGASPAHVHLGPVHGRDISEAALSVVRERADTVTLDVQGFVRVAAIGRVTEQVAPVLAMALDASSVVKADRSELSCILAAYQLTLDRLLVDYDIAEIVVTCSNDGGYVVRRTGERADYKAVRVRRLYDTTGAGDVFFSTYLVARICHDLSVADACKWAAMVAAEHVAGDYIRSDLLDLATDP